MYDDFQTLRIECSGRVARVSLNRPEQRNAIGKEMHSELARIFPLLGSDDSINVVVLTGEGDSFSAGGDIKAMAQNFSDHSRWLALMREAREILLGLIDLEKPVVARVNGAAAGLGATLALCCDIVVCKDTAKLIDPHVKIGLSAGDGGAIIWPHLAGSAKAKRYLLTGKPITGAEAERIGLVAEAVPAEQLDATVEGIVAELLSAGPLAVRMTKRSINMPLREALASLMDAHLGIETMTFLSADHREAVTAFAEKRAPQFRGV